MRQLHQFDHEATPGFPVTTGRTLREFLLEERFGSSATLDCGRYRRYPVLELGPQLGQIDTSRSLLLHAGTRTGSLPRRALRDSRPLPDIQSHPDPEAVAGSPDRERYRGRHPNLSHGDVFICGPPVMIDNLTTGLVTRGVPPQRIHSETFDFR